MAKRIKPDDPELLKEMSRVIDKLVRTPSAKLEVWEHTHLDKHDPVRINISFTVSPGDYWQVGRTL